MAHRAESIYRHLPVWLQNVGISLYGVAYRRERLAGDFQRHVAAFRERDRWSADQLRSLVEAQVRRLVVHAFDTVPHYQRTFRQAGVGREQLTRFTLADLGRLPLVTKGMLRAAPREFIASTYAADRLHRYESSGSTGTPVSCFFSADAHRRFFAAKEARSFGWAGTSIREPRSMIGGRLVVPRAAGSPPFHRVNWAERQIYFSAFHISPANVEHYVAALNRYRPSVLTGYASAHYLLAGLMRAQNRQLDYEPKALVLSSEGLTDEMRQTLREAFRAPAFQEYGLVENCAFASECEQGRLHVSSDFGLIEILGEDDRPVAEGEIGRIVCTGLLNDAQPLIRYEVGDLGAWDERPCPCGRNQFPVLREIVGRIEDVLTGPDGRQIIRFHWIFLELAGLIEGQIVQEGLDRFRVRVVTTDAFGEREARTIRRRFAERVGAVHVEIERVASIERTARGKLKAVINRYQAGSASSAGGAIA